MASLRQAEEVEKVQRSRSGTSRGVPSTLFPAPGHMAKVSRVRCAAAASTDASLVERDAGGSRGTKDDRGEPAACCALPFPR
jgi:hypothetical protein